MAKLTSQPVHESSTPNGDENLLQGLRAKYEQALLKDNEAKARLAQLHIKDVQPVEALSSFGRNTGVATSRRRHLESHLENLRLQKRYRNLRILSQYAEQADQIASDEDVLTVQGFRARSVGDANDSEQQATIAATQQHLEALHKDAKARTAELEIALVKARQQLKSEQNLLERAEIRSKTSRNGAATNESGLAKQRAMEVTRDELQNWIAGSLARCEREISPLTTETSATRMGGGEQPEEDIDAAIDNEYEQYLEVRLRLVHMADTLKAPLTESEGLTTNSVSSASVEAKSPSEDQKQRPVMQRATHLRHKSRMSIHKLTEQTSGSSLTKIESSHLPKYHHERLLNTHMAYLEGQTTAQDARLLQRLGLLSHESHLLPSYPLQSGDNVQKDQLRDLSRQQSEIEHLLRAWGFASETAEVVLEESVLGNIEDTRDALERARQHLEEVRIMEEMRKRVAMN